VTVEVAAPSTTTEAARCRATRNSARALVSKPSGSFSRTSARICSASARHLSNAPAAPSCSFATISLRWRFNVGLLADRWQNTEAQRSFLCCKPYRRTPCWNSAGWPGLERAGEDCVAYRSRPLDPPAGLPHCRGAYKPPRRAPGWFIGRRRRIGGRERYERGKVPDLWSRCEEIAFDRRFPWLRLPDAWPV
jgi:hypothetical protein